MSIIGEAVRTARAEKEWSQVRLAQETGVSREHVSALESGRKRPSCALLFRLALHLELDLNELARRAA